MKPIHRFLLFAIGMWIMAESIVALILINPPTGIWQIVRFIRIVIGAVLLVEARRVRLNFLLSKKEDSKVDLKYVIAYIDLLDFIGIWLIVDGVGTAVMGYEYPILIWQLIRAVRAVVGLSLALGVHLLWFKVFGTMEGGAAGRT
jgi:hypothetical protein